MSIENKIERIETPLARLILTVSHLPDVEWDLEGMKKSARSAVSTLKYQKGKLTFQVHRALPRMRGQQG